MNTTAKARIVTRAIVAMLQHVNLPVSAVRHAYALMTRASSGCLDGVAEFLRTNLFRCSGALASVVGLTAELVA